VRINLQATLKRNQRQSPGGRPAKGLKSAVVVDVDTKNGGAMREINIKLWRNEELHDWSMEINGRFHQHVSNEGLTDLVESALIVAAKSLIQPSVSGKTLQGH
jgi:hypothetical protein